MFVCVWVLCVRNQNRSKAADYANFGENFNAPAARTTSTVYENAEQYIGNWYVVHLRQIHLFVFVHQFVRIRFVLLLDPLRQPQNPLGTRSEINHTINWVRSHLEHDPNVSIPKQDVYEDYV